MYDRRESSQVGYRQLALDYMKGSPLIPAGLAASTFSGPQLTSNGANVAYTFDEYGRMSSMSTYRGGAGWENAAWPTDTGRVRTVQSNGAVTRVLRS